MCENMVVCVCVCVSVRVYVRAYMCVSLDKTVNPQATRTQYPVCPFLISCLSLAEWEAVGWGLGGGRGQQDSLPQKQEIQPVDLRKVYTDLPISPFLVRPPILTPFSSPSLLLLSQI